MVVFSPSWVWLLILSPLKPQLRFQPQENILHASILYKFYIKG